MKRFSLRLADKEYEGLEEIAADLEQSMNDLIREAVRLYLASHGKK
jgi:metal-responsive CopG/Arc/MetJ family transcriptional regulator